MGANNITNISIIGSGNLGYHLAQRFQERGLIIDQVFSRKEENARQLAEIINTRYCTQLSEIQSLSDLYILAVSDGAIQEVAKQISLILPENSLVVHTSGATPSSVFRGHFDNRGIFYPLQSFSKEKVVDFEKIPICVHAHYPNSLQQLKTLAQRISPKVYEIDDEQRAYLHVAAVFANNFSNYLFHVAHELCQQHQVPFDLLRPLILETAQKVQDHPPIQMQTGPAIRSDEATMNRHLELLKKHPSWMLLYQSLSTLVQDMSLKK